MDFPIKVSQLKSTSEQKDVFDKLFKVPSQQKQRVEQRSQSKNDIINELRQENTELKTLVNELRQRILELESQREERFQRDSSQIEEEKQEPISVEKSEQFQGGEMTEEERSVHLALMLQQQEEVEFQNRLLQMQNNVDLDEMSYEQLQELQESMGFVSRGLLLNQIKSLLHACKITEQTNDCCTICLEDSGNQVEIQLDCNHVFHSACISEWLSREKHCPVCKRDINLGKYQ